MSFPKVQRWRRPPVRAVSAVEPLLPPEAPEAVAVGPRQAAVAVDAANEDKTRRYK
jgi:hypothetical protein